MSDNNYFPSSGFKGTLKNQNWWALQKYLTQAAAIPHSDDSVTASILAKLKSAAQSFSQNTLTDSQKLGNDLYNYAVTVVATLKGLEQLMQGSSAPKDAVEQLVDSLTTAATGNLKAPNSVQMGVSQFSNNTSSTALSLAKRLEQVKASALSADTTVQNTSASLATALAASELDVHAIQSDIKTLQAAVAAFNGISFSGLDFDPQPGIKAAGAIAEELKALVQAWTTLGKELQSLVVQIKHAAAVDTTTFPGLAPSELNAQVSDWQKIETMAHQFMLNFFNSTD